MEVRESWAVSGEWRTEALGFIDPLLFFNLGTEGGG